jgi:hypothetical protein
MMKIGLIILLRIEELGYKFDLGLVFDKMRIPHPKRNTPEPISLSVDNDSELIKTITKLAAETGFYLDERDPERLIACTDRGWFTGHDFYACCSEDQRKSRYRNKPKEEQRRIFRKLLFDAENYRQEYPAWRESQERKDKKLAAELEKEKVRLEAPVQCECGGLLDAEKNCPKCGGRYCFDEKLWEWEFYHEVEPGLSKGFQKAIAGKKGA